MKTSMIKSLKFKNSLIFISIMVPLFIGFLTYEVNQQSTVLRKTLIERGIVLAQTGAVSVGKVLSDAIDDGKLTEDQVFDTNYQLIPNTSPPKYHTQYDEFTDKNIRIIEDSFLKDEVVVFAVAVDVNGYLPTHNNKYSQPGGGLNYDRTKRIFDDDVGLAAARNTASYKFQEYRRDTGEIMWDISAPIYVKGRHWGAFRIGFSIEKTEAQVAAAVNRMVVSGILITIAMVILAVYVSMRIANRVKIIAEEANRVAQGDFSLSNLMFDSDDELGNLGRSFANMIIKLRDLTGKTRNMAELINNYTHDLLKNTEHVAHSAGTLTSKLDTVSESIGVMENKTQQISESSQSVLNELNVAETSSRKFLESMEESNKAMLVANNVVSELEFQVDKVGQFIQIVSILSEQASLMAEKIVQQADKICSHGNELSALAVEVQSNALDAANTTKDVAELFQKVRDYARQASKTLESHRSIIIEGIKVASSSEKSLKTIVFHLEELMGLTKEFLQFSKQLVQNTSGIYSDLENQTGLVKQVTSAAETLEKVVQEFQENIKTLKV